MLSFIGLQKVQCSFQEKRFGSMGFRLKVAVASARGREEGELVHFCVFFVQFSVQTFVTCLPFRWTIPSTAGFDN